ncbi:MAG: class II glutamine amidotransferase [Thermoproteota archaeon]|jgi:Predicted glutamine amidotransferase
MCRLLGYISTENINPYNMIFEAKYCILNQVKIEKHNDGWGLCSFEEGEAKFLFKSTKSLSDSLNEAKSVVGSINSKCFMFFVRLASNPLRLERDKIIRIEATQPFVYNNFAFMHNGTVRIPKQILEQIYDFELKPYSYNDSEAYFLLFLYKLRLKGNVYEALKETEETMYKIGKQSGIIPPFSSMNVIICDGKRIFAYNRYESKLKESISDKEREYYKMCYYYDEDRLIISSEPIDDNYEDLGDGKFIEGWIEDDKVKFKILQLK